jgi:hypothetical protein
MAQFQTAHKRRPVCISPTGTADQILSGTLQMASEKFNRRSFFELGNQTRPSLATAQERSAVSF